MNAKCEEVIITDMFLRGKGTPSEPYRRVVQVWDKDGTLIAENDPLPPPLHGCGKSETSARAIVDRLIASDAFSEAQKQYIIHVAFDNGLSSRESNPPPANSTP
jgi:hypothetical protein